MTTSLEQRRRQLLAELAEVERPYRLRDLRREVNACPPPGLSRAQRATYGIAHAADPDADALTILRRLRHTRFRATISFFKARMRELIKARQRSGEPLDPDTDPELRHAIAAASAEEIEALVPGRPLNRAIRRTPVAALMTYEDDQRWRDEQAELHRRMARIDEMDGQIRDMRARRQLAAINGRIADLERERDAAVADEAAQERRERARQYVADLLGGAP